ncbi:hypothetical protein IT571_04495 [Candidatus Sumerlaeota bacterium]|nr:hypothetical protein [Candidatus Sumerlaeota bacterium]
MRAFDQKIVDLLRGEIGTEPIFFVGLGAFDFQIAFGDLKRVQNMQKVEFNIAGENYNWEEGASPAPVWLLINQIPVAVELESSSVLRMSFASGDWVRFHTEEGAHESQIFEWTKLNRDGIGLEIY